MGKKVSIDIYDVNNNLIVPKGMEITKYLLKDIALKNPENEEDFVSLKETQIYKDIKVIMKEKNYKILFEDETVRKKTLASLSLVSFPKNLIKELLNLKKTAVFIYHHSLSTTLLAERVAMEYMFYQKSISKVVSATLTKDIGMSRLPRNIITNTDFLSKEEYDLINEHTLWGIILLVYYLGEGTNALVSFRHHDNGQHPDFKILDLVIALDIFNALISPRTYRKQPYDIRGALDLLSDMAAEGRLADEMIKRLVSAYRQEYQTPDKIKLSEEKLGFIPKDNYYGIKDL